MQALIEKFKTEGPQVIQSSGLTEPAFSWGPEEIEQVPITEYEKELLKNTVNPEVLLEKEKAEEKIIVDKKREVITKAKVIALDRMACYPLTNPSFFSKKDKAILIKHMQDALDLPEEDMTKLFNEVCTDKIFTEKADFSNFPVYNC